ncbi:hypothetical protein KUTeg_014365 [Tegillarca granosa]|uniref:Uncharacterized protein n=1 Tax=Tegillarca granosa TaxID=220873 RepID=A0ABQ9EZW8_TEGGR|nr:hypothetical protein KUTeg_012985 [Tegillarca granosa]KAJ8309491.1 hypothetical protein KUTeg_014365 [Tegillarca granosa]
MAIEDITRFYHNDLVVADSCGMMTVFCNQQILCRQSVSDACINFIQVEVDKTGNQVIVLSDDNGLVMGVLPSSELWKVNINNTKLTKELGPKLTVKCVLSVDLTNSHGQRSSYIMVSDCHNHVYMLQQGTIVMVLETPAVITAKIGDYPTTDWICSMNTIDLDNDGVKEVVVGCLDNSIHAIKVSPT